MERCPWAAESPEREYHDTEWGVPVYDDARMFEHLCLEAAQCGLSWRLVLQRRAAYQRAFHGFDIAKVAAMGEDELRHAVQNGGIIRNSAKAQAVVHNARLTMELQAKHGGLADWMWTFVGGRTRVNQWTASEQIPATSVESREMSAALRKLGFKFVGPTTLYAHMQACGLVDDHLVGCFRKQAGLGGGRA
jgi:DNA-3-methyladenine glycosylase I